MGEVPLYSPLQGYPSSGEQAHALGTPLYKGTSLIRKCIPLRPYRSPMPRDLW